MDVSLCGAPEALYSRGQCSMVRWVSLSSVKRKPKSEGEDGAGPGCRPSSDTSILGQNIRARDPCQVTSTETRPTCLAVHSSEWHEKLCMCQKKNRWVQTCRGRHTCPRRGGWGLRKARFHMSPENLVILILEKRTSTESGFFLDSKHTRAGSLSDSHPSIEITEHRGREDS